MPPAISDDENSDGGVDMPILSKRDKKRVDYGDEDADRDEDDIIESDVKNGADDEAEDDEDDELEQDEYVVEKILSHFVDDDGNVQYEVKWEGFEKKSDRTWEPEENLTENASAALEAYFESIGGRDKLKEQTEKALKSKKRGRPSASTGSNGSKRSRKSVGHPADTDSPASRQSREFRPPAGSWDDHIDLVDMFRDENGSLMVYLSWKNGHKTQHPAKQAYTRCPQKILQFYESKITFRSE